MNIQKKEISYKIDNVEIANYQFTGILIDKIEDHTVILELNPNSLSEPSLNIKKEKENKFLNISINQLIPENYNELIKDSIDKFKELIEELEDMKKN